MILTLVFVRKDTLKTNKISNAANLWTTFARIPVRYHAMLMPNARIHWIRRHVNVSTGLKEMAPIVSVSIPSFHFALDSALTDVELKHLPTVDILEIIWEEWTTDNLRLLDVVNSFSEDREYLLRNVTVDIHSRTSMIYFLSSSSILTFGS